MAQAEKAVYYQALKAAEYPFEKHYREYTTKELREKWEGIAPATGQPAVLPSTADPERALPTHQPADDGAELRAQLAQLTRTVASLAQVVAASAAPAPAPVQQSGIADPPVDWGTPPEPAVDPRVKAVPSGLDPAMHAGLTQNSHGEDEVVKIDEHGNRWFQLEVVKSGFPKTRVRRTLRQMDHAVREETVRVGDYTETFEVSGDVQNLEPTEIKVTLPTYQTGIFIAPGMPFRTHVYNGARGFNLFDVEKFYGGPDYVPHGVKRIYVGTDLCYDIQTVIHQIETEHRDLVLKKGI